MTEKQCNVTLLQCGREEGSYLYTPSFIFYRCNFYAVVGVLGDGEAGLEIGHLLLLLLLTGPAVPPTPPVSSWFGHSLTSWPPASTCQWWSWHWRNYHTSPLLSLMEAFIFIISLFSCLVTTILVNYNWSEIIRLLGLESDWWTIMWTHTDILGER